MAGAYSIRSREGKSTALIPSQAEAARTHGIAGGKEQSHAAELASKPQSVLRAKQLQKGTTVKRKQLDKLRDLLTSQRGATSVEISKALPSVSPHRRIADLRNEGYTIVKKQEGKLKRYWAVSPMLGL